MDTADNIKILSSLIPLVKPVLEEVIKPVVRTINKTIKNKSLDNKALDDDFCEKIFEGYLCKTLEKCSILNTLIFPNQQITIESLYQPLTLCSNNEKIKIQSFPSKLFEKYQRVLICDSAGMGKSTLSRYICVQVMKERKGIPVFIELRKLNSANGILDELLNQLNTINHHVDKDFVLRLLSSGKFVIILDGFDEIQNEELEFVTQNVRNFVFDCGENMFLLTSRPDAAVTTFGDFKIVHINGLKKEEAFQLLNRYDSIACANISKCLIAEIKGSNSQVEEFLINPFLVSLLYKTYSFKRDIPSKKSTFYNEVYTALYQDHDLSKDSYKRDKKSKLDIQEFRLVLREFAIMTAKKGEVEYSKQKAVQYITECKTKLPFMAFKESLFVEDLLSTVPIFTVDGNNIKWAHKSLQDYFAAEYITYHPRKDLIINKLINSSITKYFNIIDLVIELDPVLIRQYVLPDILSSLIEYYNNIYNFENIGSYDLSIRKMLTFEADFWMSRCSLSGGKEFDKMREYINSNYDKIPECMTNFGNGVMVAVHRSGRYYFLQIMGYKGLLGRNVVRARKFDSLPKSILPKEPYLLSDTDVNSVFNSSEYFVKINNLMMSMSNPFARDSVAFVADIEYCKRLFCTINEELKDNKNANFLDDF